MSKPKVLRCTCGKTFASASSMAMHIKAVHKGPQPDAKPVKQDGWFKRLLKKIFGKPQK